MYRKALINDRELFFVYAPPQSDLDRPNNKLPKKPRPDVPTHENSVYYYWWAFLRLNKAYRDCCDQAGRGPLKELYKDFGDVRNGQRTLDEFGEFKAWWSEEISTKGEKKLRCEYLFAEPRRTDFIEVISKPRDHLDTTHHLYLSIPLRGDLQETLEELRSTIAPKFADYRNQNGHFSRALYKIHETPDTNLLYHILQTRLAKEKNPEIDHAELADLVGITINRSYENSGNLERDKRRRVNDYLDRAKALVHNVAQGRFPDFTIPNADRSKKRLDEDIDWENM